MQIYPINYTQPQFKAINQKYLKWAEKEMRGAHMFGELFFQIKFDVYVKDMSPQDGIDTVKAIKEIMPINRHPEAERVLTYIKSWLE